MRVVALNPIQSLFLLLTACLPLISGQGIYQLVTLDDLRAGSESSFTLNLYSLVAGPNITFFINGSYSPHLPTNGITIDQNLNLMTSIPKPQESRQYQSYGGLQMDRRSILYTLEGNSLNLWDALSLPNVTNLTAYAVNVAQGATLVSTQAFFVPKNESDFIDGYNYVVTMDSVGYTFTFRVINTTDLQNITEIPSLSMSTNLTTFDRATFVQDEDYIWGFLYSANSIDVFQLNITGNLRSAFITSITSKDFNVEALSPVGIAFGLGTGYYCDQILGVIQFEMEYSDSTQPTFNITQQLLSPIYVGKLFSCTIFDYILTVDTSGGTLLYSLPSLEPMIAFPFNNSYTVIETYGMTSNGDFTMGYVNTQAEKKEIPSFRIFANSFPYYNSLLIDIPLFSLLQGDMSNQNPSFMIAMNAFLGQDSDVQNYVIVNAGKKLLVYQVVLGSFITFPAQPVAYNFTGLLSVNNGQTTVSYPVQLQGVSPNSSMIFPYRGIYDTEGYPAPTNYSTYVFQMNGTSFTSYIPLSNYFEGANVTYSLTSSKGQFTPIIYNPPNQLLKSTNLLMTFDYNIPSMATYSADGLCDYVFVLGTTSVSVSFFNNSILQGQFLISSSIPGLQPTYVTFGEFTNLTVLIESAGTVNNNFVVAWEIYALTPTSAKLLNVTHFTNRPPSSKIMISVDVFYSLYGNAIDIFNIITNSTVFSLQYWLTISSETLYPQIEFSPVTFGVYDGLFVYDFINGLIEIDIYNETIQNVTLFNISFPNTYDAQMESDYFYLLIFVRTFASGMVYKIPFTSMDSYTLMPELHCEIPVGLRLNSPFYSVLCAGGNNFYAQIFDINAPSYASLYTELNFPNGGDFILGSLLSYYPYTGSGYFSNGTHVLGYIVGQAGDALWDPNYPQPYQPDLDSSIVTWARVTYDFSTLVYYPQYPLVFNLTASNIYMSQSMTIDFTLINTVDYIKKNPNFNPQSNRLTSGDIYLDVDFVEPIPLVAFTGNNIEFAFQINGSTVNYLPSTPSCPSTINQFFCLENKTHEFLSEPGEFNDFDYNAPYLFATNDTNIMVYNFTNPDLELIQLINMENAGLNGALCYQIRYVSLFNSFVVSCTMETNYGITNFLAVINMNSSSCASPYFISYQTVWMDVFLDENSVVWIYHYEGTTISILNLANLSSPDTCNYVFQPQSALTQNGLFISNFEPVGLKYISLYYLVMAEQTLGLVLLTGTQFPDNIVYSVSSIITLQNNVIDILESQVMSINLLSDRSTALVVMSTADVYMVNVTGGVVLSHFPKLMQTGYFPNNKLAAVYEKYTTLAFPVFSLDKPGVIRFLNYSLDPSTSIYRDRPLGQQNPSSYPQRLLFDPVEPILYHNINPTSFLTGGGPLHFVLMRNQPLGYLYTAGGQYDGYIAVVGFSGDSSSSKSQFAPIDYYYPESPPVPEVVETTHIFRSSWNTWYFWVILGLFSIVLIASLIAIFVCISKRGRASSSLSIGLTTVNP